MKIRLTDQRQINSLENSKPERPQGEKAQYRGRRHILMTDRIIANSERLREEFDYDEVASPYVLFSGGFLLFLF